MRRQLPIAVAFVFGCGIGTVPIPDDTPTHSANERDDDDGVDSGGPPPVSVGDDAPVPCADDEACSSTLGPDWRCDPDADRCFLPGQCDPVAVNLAPCAPGTQCQSDPTEVLVDVCGGCSEVTPCRAGERCDDHAVCRAETES